MANAKTTDKIKDSLFDDFYSCATITFEALEEQFNITGVRDQIFGKNAKMPEAIENLRNNRAWTTLTRIYDYAVNGVSVEDVEPTDMVIGGADVLKLVSSENMWPSEKWDDIIAMGDGRFALDAGDNIELHKVALLANVDIRTVRNAVSSGDLISSKYSDTNIVCIDNASARRWLHGRRGFKPTVMRSNEKVQSLETIDTPVAFGSFLANQRKQLGLDNNGDKLVVFHPSVTPQAITQLEAGIFTLPLDAAFPIADFYQLNRRTFLQCVMRVFFYTELRMISERAGAEEA